MNERREDGKSLDTSLIHQFPSLRSSPLSFPSPSLFRSREGVTKDKEHEMIKWPADARGWRVGLWPFGDSKYMNSTEIFVKNEKGKER